MATANDDPILGDGPSEDSDDLLYDSDSDSVLSDDSEIPCYDRDERYTELPKTMYEACARNNIAALHSILERGVTEEEVMELDINGRNGLMLAVSKGFVDIVTVLNTCPLIDINHQDTDGNTALMIAAQAGFNTILNYILNYYSGVDTEVRDPRGFTALIKAGLQGREDCVATLLMHGADIDARDLVQGRGVKEWAIRTGRFETVKRLRRLQAHPVADHFCENYLPEWPQLQQFVAKATASKTPSQKLRQHLNDSFTFRFPHDPEDNGVIDHMVRMTTSIHSPLVATACRPLCPSSPPEIGKRRLALPDLLVKYNSKELEEGKVSHSNDATATAAASLISCCQESERRDSIVPSGVRSFIPRSMAHRNSIFPSGCLPRIKVTKSLEPTPKKEKKRKGKGKKGDLELPVWKYKEAKEERQKKELEEKSQVKKIKKSKCKHTSSGN
ncbi:ankyrin repeat domain-containing protein 33B [Thalassophryne amazonica]|uniref:ankyrin repeat domain-containing protein 33B n=1 Tax=Thalassophryne amazonica TaxID=390379 RepID=UPI0014711817|nr:ankyrin repeat domain-containing protein 33B [Thalassophryne amazonica]